MRPAKLVRNLTVSLVAAAALSLPLADSACHDTGTGEMATGDGGTSDAATLDKDMSSTLDCYMNPTTHVEIINACTTAQALDVTPVLPLLEADGSLPPIP